MFFFCSSRFIEQYDDIGLGVTNDDDVVAVGLSFMADGGVGDGDKNNDICIL